MSGFPWFPTLEYVQQFVPHENFEEHVLKLLPILESIFPVTYSDLPGLLREASQDSINCAHGDERARNVHTERFSQALTYLHVNESKHLS